MLSTIFHGLDSGQVTIIFTLCISITLTTLTDPTMTMNSIISVELIFESFWGWPANSSLVKLFRTSGTYIDGLVQNCSVLAMEVLQLRWVCECHRVWLMACLLLSGKKTKHYLGHMASLGYDELIYWDHNCSWSKKENNLQFYFDALALHNSYTSLGEWLN